MYIKFIVMMTCSFFYLQAGIVKAPLECPHCCNREMGPFIVLAVEARHLNYSSTSALLKTMSKHPSDGSKNSDVGHAWIYMECGGEIVYGGHSAETGLLQPKYIEGVCLLAEKNDPNPARYLFKQQKDGFFEIGSGGHRPTFAVKIPILEEHFNEIKAYLKTYPWDTYSLNGKNCATLVADIAQLLGIHLNYIQTIKLDSEVVTRGERLQLWENPIYSVLDIASPDILEKSLIKLAETGAALPCTKWISKKNPTPFYQRIKRIKEDFTEMPRRTLRYLEFKFVD